MEPNNIALKCLKFASDTYHAFLPNIVSRTGTNDELIKFSFPPPGLIKINSDGSTFGDFGWAAYGGLARDSLGRWIEEFAGRIGYATPLQAELWGIRRAMKLANERAWLDAIVETDSLAAVNLINTEDTANHQDRNLINDCKKLKEDMHLELVHVLREGNKCANYLSKLGRIQGEQYMRILCPINELVQLLKADMQGVAFRRGD